MSSTSKTLLAQSQIPQIRELQEKLGFDGRDGRAPAELRDATHHFRKEYLTSDGMPGRDLKDWKTPRTQAELLRMARTFLADEHYGMKFWPANTNSSSKLGLEYPRDSDKLAELLQQLFWRQNKYSAHNANNPDRNRHVRESVESDSSSGTVRPNKSFMVTHPRYVPLSDQDLQRLPSRVGTDTQSPGVPEEVPNSRGLPSFRGETTGTVEQRESRLSEIHGKWGISNNSGRSPTTPTRQPPNTSTNAEDSDDADLPEDIFAYYDSRRGLVRRRSGPAEEPIEASNNQHEGDGITQIVEPRPQGAAPAAKMLGSQDVKRLAARQMPITPDITPDHRGTTEKSPTSRPKPPTESKKAKRKVEEDDDSEYTPSKKVKWDHEDFSNIASSKPRRRRAGNADENSIQLQSGSTVEQLTSPSTTFSTSITGTDRVSSIRSANLPEFGQPSTPENRNIPVENSPSIPSRTPHLDKLREKKKKKEEKQRSESMNEIVRAHHQTKLNFSPTSRPVETRLQIERSPSVDPFEIRSRDVADETSPSPEPNPNTTIQASEDEVDDALNIAANILDHDSVPSQTSRDTGLATPEPAQDDPPPQITDIVIDIRYSIIASRIPRLVKRNWPIRSLSGKTVRTLFEEVAKFTSKPNIQRIVFTLNLSQADSEYTIQKDDQRTFEAMKDDFADDITADWKENGITKFSIWLELDPMEEGNQMNLGASGGFHVDEGCPRIII